MYSYRFTGSICFPNRNRLVGSTLAGRAGYLAKMTAIYASAPKRALTHPNTHAPFFIERVCSVISWQLIPSLIAVWQIVHRLSWSFHWKCQCKPYMNVQDTLLCEKMRRNEAILYLKALLGSDIYISPDSVSIEEQQASKTVEIRIKISNIQREQIRETAKKRDLIVKEENDSMVIYS